jgi:type IV secretory pathway VirD2 relaxase
MKARVVRHHGSRFRSAPLPKHINYLKREGVTRDGEDARMFDANSEVADERAFAERCKDDRHHFRFIISPEDAAELENLRAFTRELLGDVERDLGTKLDWVAVDHWNTDNPHVHVLIRGRTDDGQDLVISRAYISRGFRDRAAERVTMELGPRSDGRSSPRWSARSKPSAGPASTVPCAASRTTVPGSPTSVLVRRIWIPSYAGFCLAEPTSLNAWAWPNGSPRPAGR